MCNCDMLMMPLSVAPKLTDWYPANVKPVRAGWYEAQISTGQIMLWWHGGKYERWLYHPYGPSVITTVKKWRGLALSWSSKHGGRNE